MVGGSVRGAHIPSYSPRSFEHPFVHPSQLGKIMQADPYFVTQDNGSGAPAHFAVTYRQLVGGCRSSSSSADKLEEEGKRCPFLHSFSPSLSPLKDMLHHLLNLGAEVNQRDNKGFTPLHRAAYLAHLDGYAEIYEYLLVGRGERREEGGKEVEEREGVELFDGE
jgi:[acyl-carrier-protein] S-malonyltransferase